MRRRFATIDLPTKLRQVVAAFHVPFADISGLVIALAQTLRPVGLICSQHALISVPAVFHLQYTMVMW